MDPEPDAGPARTPSRFTGRALIVLLVVAVLGVSYASSVRAWLNQRDEESSLTTQIAAERATIAQLQAAKARWNDPAYIEAQARLRFGWVMPGERSYRVIGTDGKVLTTPHGALTAPLPSVSAARPPWWQATVDSLVTAGSPPPPVSKKTHPAHRPATFIGRSAGR